MKYKPSECVKCGSSLASPGRSGGRPSRFCCEGCKVSAEAEMRRVNVLLRKLEEGLALDQLNPSLASARRPQVIADLQARFDHLAGVPPRERS